MRILSEVDNTTDNISLNNQSVCIMEDKKFKSQMKKLKQAFKDGEKFVLFIGAGQNGGHNVRLMWNQLINQVSKTSFRNLFQQMGVNYTDSHAILRAMEIEDTGKHSNTQNDGNSNNDKHKEESADLELVKYLNTYFPIEIQVSMIKDLMKDHYIPALQNHLYTQCNYHLINESFGKLYAGKASRPEDFTHLPIPNPTSDPAIKERNKNDKEYYTLFVLARMILLNPQIESIITYNFDNFIRQAVKVLLKSPEKYFTEKEIEFLNKRFSLIYNKEKERLSEKVLVKDVHDNNNLDSKNVTLNCFPVYHVHGYIPDPNEEEIRESPDIVMALEEFVEQQTDGLSWEDSIQVSAFRNSNIIFIGCSMTDLTMKRMINYAHASGYNNKIFILNATSSPESSKSQVQDGDSQKFILNRQKNILDQLRRKYFESIGATYVNCPNGFNALCDALYTITHLNLNNANDK